ncbi:putative cupin 4 family protein [Calothrix sp. NIES-4071]|nr:putative cupin 4 family protein [Calothrix sp. NIES-4071]BAZ57212.1 putative cupin 4 family protein [Calothrix sp. NIES-4105]
MDNNYNFTHLIYPYNPTDFFQYNWEKKYIYISRKDDFYYKNVLNEDDIDLFLQDKKRQAENDNFLLVKDGQKLDYNYWAKKRDKTNQYLIDTNKIFTLLNQGVTLVINSGHKSIPKLINFCNSLEKELRFRVRTNIYITPPTAQGLAPHYDEHDVCILQITGTKIWHLYHSPIKLPCNENHKIKDFPALGEPDFTVELQPGDLLYIPRGLIHQAFTTDKTSIHIALGLYPTYGFELLQELVELAQDNPTFRKAIPHGFTNDEDKKLFNEEFRQLCQELVDNLDVDALLARKDKQFIEAKGTEDGNRFQDWLNINQINLNTVLSRRQTVVFSTDKDAENIYINFYNKRLVFPKFMAISLTTIISSDSFVVKDIGGLINDKGKLDLATKFVQEGFLKIENLNADVP